MRRAAWGPAGLFLFELILAAYLASVGAATFALVGAGLVLALGFALWRAWRGEAVPRWLLGVVAALTLVRALLQSTGGLSPVFVFVYAVPVGWALPALSPRLAAPGVLLVAVARSWFVGQYLLAGATVIGLANVFGAAGAWLWWSALVSERPAPAEDASPGPGSS
ncbi:MAG: hypothetical protein QOE90_3614 [Thermoplasmata archaeon]|jgi:hypothetical protein|nr:hypothetical protein [Thermoplasmata archaeon]